MTVFLKWHSKNNGDLQKEKWVFESQRRKKSFHHKPFLDFKFVPCECTNSKTLWLQIKHYGTVNLLWWIKLKNAFRRGKR
jgi:hypothetical protein